MKVGDYVRFDGEIAKIRDIKRYKTKENIYVFDRILDLSEDRACNDNTIYNSHWQYFDNVKSSPDIIDLIEVGDYVNGERVVEKSWLSDTDGEYDEYRGAWCVFCESCSTGYEENDIKSIVTKEQFSQMEYKVGE